MDLTFVFRPASPFARHELAHLQWRAAEPGTDERLVLDMEHVASRGPGRLGSDTTAARAPRDTSSAPARARPTCRPASLARPRDAVQTAGTAAPSSGSGGRCVLYPRLVRGNSAPEAQTHQLVLHDAMRALSRPSCELHGSSLMNAGCTSAAQRRYLTVSVWFNLLSVTASLVYLIFLAAESGKQVQSWFL